MAVTVQDIYMIQQEVYAEICEVYPQARSAVVEDFCSGWWFGTFFIFPYTVLVLGIIIPTDFHIFQRG